jgi:hypothetical protein
LHPFFQIRAMHMLGLIGRWFYQPTVSQDYRQADYVVLGLILAVGVFLRFWGLDNVGLHGDEDIMALAARGVLEHGIPILPSEAVYARAPLHTYIMSGSMYVFGDSEWAIRFPSAVVGSLCGLLAFFMGKRFLEPKFNLAFAALITFLPSMIEISQTGRMYVFFVACLLGFGALLFRWEGTGRMGALVSAFLVWLLALQFHSLAIFAAPLFLFPGLSRQSWSRLIQGAIALGIAVVAFYRIDRWVSLRYPEEAEKLSRPVDAGAGPLELLAQGPWQLALVFAVAAISIVAYFGFRNDSARVALAPAVLLLALGVVACASLHYHVGGILLLLGAVAWLRAKPGSYRALVLLALAVALICAVQLVILHGSGQFQGRQIIGALVGTPSIWPILRFSEFSYVGVGLYAVILVFAAWQLSKGRPLPVHFLLFVLAAWAPLFGIGIFKSDPAVRYMLGIMPFFMLCLLAGVTYAMSETRFEARRLSKPFASGAALLVLVIAFVNPVAVSKAASNDYRSFPDHKGAAEFIKSINPGPEDILIAEDSINQTYYLGRVDYRLLSVTIALTHSVVIDGVLRGQYTGTPIMGTGEELLTMLDHYDKGQIYIIGSGESFVGGRRSRPRRDGIYEVLESDRLEVLYIGRDGKTKVWRRRS